MPRTAFTTPLSKPAYCCSCMGFGGDSQPGRDCERPQRVRMVCSSVDHEPDVMPVRHSTTALPDDIRSLDSDMCPPDISGYT